MMDTESQVAAGKITCRPGLIAEYTGTTGAVLAGRSGFDSATGNSRPYGGAWEGSVFVLTHHPEDAPPAEGITILSCSVVEVFSPSIGRQLLGLRYHPC